MRGISFRFAAVYVALSLLSVPLCAWFALNAHAFTQVAQSRIDSMGVPGVVHVDRVAWSLFPLRLDLYDVTLLNRKGTPTLSARHIGVLPDWDQSHRGDRDIAIHVDRLEINEFSLDLTWNQEGRLELSDAFRRRAFDASKAKRPPWKVVIDAPDIVLGTGLLTLNWPRMGFQFEGLNTQGKLWIAPDELIIDVPSLQATDGVFSHHSPPEALRAKLQVVLPTDPKKRGDRPGLHIPLKAISIRDFSWQDSGFQAQLSLQAPPNDPTEVKGSLRFLNDGIHHKLATTIDLDAQVTAALSGGRVEGPVHGTFTTEGVNFVGSATGKTLRASAIHAGALTVQNPSIPSVQIDTSGEEITVDLDLNAKTIATNTVRADNVKARVLAALGWAGWNADAFVREMKKDPNSLLRRFVLFGAPHAKLRVPSARANTLTATGTTWTNVILTDLSLHGELRSVKGALKSLNTDQGTKTSASLATRLMSLELTVSHENTRTQTLRQWYGDHEEWSSHDSVVPTSVVSLRSSITKPLSFKVNKVSTETVQ